MMIDIPVKETHSLQLKRVIKANRNRVFKAWTDPEWIARWFSPGKMVVTSVDVDLRVGGIYKIVFKGEDCDGEARNEAVATGVYETIVQDEKLTFTWQVPNDSDTKTVVTVELRDTEGGTEMTLTHEGFRDSDQMARHEFGWTRGLDSLKFSCEQTDFQATISAEVSTGEAFEKIGRVSEWWATNFKGKAHELGDTFTVTFGETFVDFEISEFTSDHRIVWRVTDSNLHWLSDKKEWNGTNVVWDVMSMAGLTTVTMTHRGLVPSAECFQNCEKGWNFFVLQSLQQFLSKGRGLPRDG